METGKEAGTKDRHLGVGRRWEPNLPLQRCLCSPRVWDWLTLAHESLLWKIQEVCNKLISHGLELASLEVFTSWKWKTSTNQDMCSPHCLSANSKCPKHTTDEKAQLVET